MRSIYAGFFILFVLGLTSCSPNNVTIDNSLQKHFDENNVKGTFGIYDNGKGLFTIYNISRFKDSTYLPASTFKVVNALIGVEAGKVSDENMVIQWDGQTRFFPNGDTATAWNKDLTLAEAFKVSAVPYFQEVARRIGKDTMQRYLDSLGYGTRYDKPVVGVIDTFWLDNSVKVTADEQLGLMSKLYFDKLPFQKRTMRIVKEMMVQEKNANYTLAYKTGWGFTESGNSLGWVIGWVEENKHPYFFALNVEGAPGADLKELRVNILKGILDQLGFLKGRM